MNTIYTETAKFDIQNINELCKFRRDFFFIIRAYTPNHQKGNIGMCSLKCSLDDWYL